MNDRRPVRPHETDKGRSEDGREMCEVDEEDEDSFRYKAMEHGRKQELGQDGADQEEDAFERWMRPFNPDVERSDEESAIAENHEEAEEEGLIPKVKKVVTKPTPEEVERHMATRIPFREWCPHCVAGKSKIDPHLKRSRDERAVAKISLDYMYMATGKQEEQMGMPILVGREEKSRWHMAAVVPSKGKCAHAIRKVEDIWTIWGTREL